MNFVSWLKELVFNGQFGITHFQNYVFVVFGCILVCMVVAFIFKFLLKLMD